MWWYGRGNSGGSSLPEEKKANMRDEGEIVVAHGRLPPPPPDTHPFFLIDLISKFIA